MRDYRKEFAQKLEQMGQTKDPLQAQYEAEVMKDSGPSATNRSLIALADNLTGSKFSQTLPQQQTTQDKLGKLLALRQQQEQQKLGGLGKLAQMQDQADARSAQQRFQEKMYGLKLAQAAQKNMAGAPRKLGGEDIKTVSSIDFLLNDLDKLKRGLKEGQSLKMDIMGYPIFGDNDASAAHRSAIEWFARPQSGAAIGDEERKNFANMISSLTDSDEMRFQKIDDMIEKMKQKRQAFMYGPSPYYTPQNNQGGVSRDPSNQARPAPQGFDPDSADEASLDLFLAQNGAM